MHRIAFLARRLLPALPIRVPSAFGKETVEVGKGAVSVDKESETLAVRVTRPFSSPRLTARVVRVESDAAKRLSAAMGTAFHVATILVLAPETDAAIGTGLLNHSAGS